MDNTSETTSVGRKASGTPAKRQRFNREKSVLEILRGLPDSGMQKSPFLVLDAPGLQNDFSLNLIDWSAKSNIICVGLGTSVYLQNPITLDKVELCDLSKSYNDSKELVTSVSWSECGERVAVGCQSGLVQVWDVVTSQEIAVTGQTRNISGHTDRVNAMAWNESLLVSGCRFGTILERDIRTWCKVPQRVLQQHEGEVCNLKWSPDRETLASGGSDSMLHVWDRRSLETMDDYYEHKGPVKAIAWSPFTRGLLASGGGLGDERICIRDILSDRPVGAVNAKFPVCNMTWSSDGQSLVTTHQGGPEAGFNSIFVWRYPSLKRVLSLRGHEEPIFYLATSPDSETIVTGAGDEKLNFWNPFRAIE